MDSKIRIRIKRISRVTLLALAMIPACLLVNGQIKIKNNKIIINNDVVRKELTVSDRVPGSIRVSSLYDKVNEKELLTNQTHFPWFEFVINHTVVSSNDHLWKYIDYSQQPLRNKGTEYTLHFKGVSGIVRGLYLSIKEQLFPGSTLIREQLILHVKDKRIYDLNTYKNKLHFLFPQYAYKATQNPVKSTEIKIATWDGKVLDSSYHSSYHSRLKGSSDLNLAQNHIFQPVINKKILNPDSRLSFKGPFGLLSNENYTFMMAYEHASQDTLIYGIRRGHNISSQSQQELNYMEIVERHDSTMMSSTVNMVHGGYLDGEKISIDMPYKTVWTASGFYSNNEPGQPKKLLYNYLLKWITEFPQTRETKFYYNTWAMQVDEAQKGESRGELLTYDRIFKEIRYAHQLGMDIFVLDAGWQKTAGVWKPKDSFSKGLKPIYDTLKKYGMTLGVWMAPLIISTRAERYREHPEWVIRDSKGNPIKLGSAAVFDFVSGFSDLFIKDCKWLIDHGVRYFKWDAIGTYYPFNTKGRHGNLKINSKKEIIARYGYLFPLYIKRAMTELMKYNPDVVIEIDLTENSRSLMGLSTVSAGKLFFMNNGASVYGDHSQYRAKSTRAIANDYAGIVPLQLFTYANYPHEAVPYRSQRYNVNSAIVAGRGLWGNLDLMNETQRKWVGKLISKAKQAAPFLKNTPTSVIGKVGASPEIYSKVDAQTAAGQVMAFSGSAMNYTYRVLLNKKDFLGVLDNAYHLTGDTLRLHFQFTMPDASREAFILPNQHSGIHIISCTSWLDGVHLTDNRLEIKFGAPGKMEIVWPKDLGSPKISGENKFTIAVKKDYYRIKVYVSNVGIPVVIK